MTGGTDRMIRRWDAVRGEPIDRLVVGAPDDPLAQYAGDPGAQVFRACVACHTLSPDEGNKAGPTLAGIFGRRIATLPGYNFSPALKKLDIVCSPETVSKLFEIGPAHYARHQDAGADHRLARGAQGAGRISRPRDDEIANLRRLCVRAIQAPHPRSRRALPLVGYARRRR